MYKCECGKEFEKSQSFNAHKSSCKTHYQIKYSNLDLFNKRLAKIVEFSRKSLHNNTIIRKQKALEQWISEQHKCEKCGKIMTEKFGSGRFCSSTCAHARKMPEEAKQKISNSLHGKCIKYLNRDKNTGLYLNTCTICGKKFYGKKSSLKTCSKECLSQLRHNNFLGNTNGGFREGSVKNFKYGSYKGFYCDSSYELSYLVYCLENSIPIKRNTEGFTYIYKNKEHKYYPDFLINNDTYIEIKNYHTEIVQAKINYFPKNLKYKIIYKKDIKFYVDYCIQKYGKDFCEKLYDKDKPNFLSKNK